MSAGEDPATGERIVLVESVPIDKPGSEASERAAMRAAEKVRTRLLAEADSLKVARTRSTLAALLDRWLPQHEVDPTTRMNYESQIRNYIKPNLGDIPLVLFVRDAPERLEGFYARLRRCRQLCSGKPFVEAHVLDGPHRCGEAGCRAHVCRPYSASSVRQIHAILSGALSAAVRWGWIGYSPMPAVKAPSKKRPAPRPPSPAQMARIVAGAYEGSSEWGLYVWLSAVTGARRGEVVALQWDDVDLEAGMVRLDENYVRALDGMLLKDTKTHQMRRVSIDPPTVALLRAYRAECAARLRLLGLPLTGSTWLFSAKPDLSRPRDPSAVTRRYGRLAEKLGIDTLLKELRHYSATELLTAGVDLRTVAGRLGHGDGTTTLRHYAAWVGSADQTAARTIGARMPHSATPRAEPRTNNHADR